MTMEAQMERKRKKNEYLVSQRLQQIPLTGTSEKDLALRAAYKLWLDAAIERYGARLSDAAVLQCVAQVNAFARDNIDMAIDIVSMNTMGYNTMEYAIQDYMDKPQFRPSRLKAKASNISYEPSVSEVVF